MFKTQFWKKFYFRKETFKTQNKAKCNNMKSRNLN